MPTTVTPIAGVAPAAPPVAINFASCPRTFRPVRAKNVLLACGVKPASGVLVEVFVRNAAGAFNLLTTARTDRFGKFRVRLPADAQATMRFQVTGRTVYTFTLIPRVLPHASARAM